MTTSSVAAHLTAAGLTLPQAAAPAANYAPWRISGTQLHISGQLPMSETGLLYPGLVGDTVSQAQAIEAARLCALHILAQAQAALGNLDRVQQVVRLGCFVASAPGFTNQPEVANGASDLMVQALGDKGRHARAAVGVAILPRGACVEIDALLDFI